MSIVPPASATLIWAFPTEFEEVRCFVWEHSPAGWSIAIMFGNETLALEVVPTRRDMEIGVEMMWRGLLSTGVAKFARGRRGVVTPQRVRQELSCPAPWDVFRFSARFAPDRFDVWMFDHAAYWPCPVCDRQLPRIGSTDPHVFKCQTCRRETYVYVKIPLIDCPDHGRQEADVPWRLESDKWSYQHTVIPEKEPERR